MVTCKHCPTDQVESDLRGQRFFILECSMCCAVFYSPGNRKKVPGWKDGKLTPEYSKHMEFENWKEWRKWGRARRETR